MLPFALADNPVQKNLRKINNSSKVRKYQIMLIFVSANFWSPSAKNLFLQGMLFTNLCSYIVLGFFLCPKMLIFNSFGDSCINLWITFLILDIKFRLNCVKRKDSEIFIKNPQYYELDCEGRNVRQCQ